MSKPTTSEYISALYGLFTPWEETNFSADVANFFGQPDPIEIMPEPRYLGGDVVLDGDIGFGVSTSHMGVMPDAVASMILNDEDELTIVQLQAIHRAERLIKKWPFMLVGIAEETARRSGADSIAILPGERNPWCPQEEGQGRDYVRRGGRSTEEVIQGFQLRYNGTAKRAGYKGTDGLYHKSLA